uniref:Uncharacterized protein n=1 Tax=Neospora caninum (strain Liverpool) TaxID=572307 RepID=F0JB14_NEOCL|nr:hypothetical protein, conserved [Neospora caninum Liverpool]CEL71280.1 TPA: hypothetical protein, conserved [Neospora caninum Liverpool]
MLDTHWRLGAAPGPGEPAFEATALRSGWPKHERLLSSVSPHELTLPQSTCVHSLSAADGTPRTARGESRGGQGACRRVDGCVLQRQADSSPSDAEIQDLCWLLKTLSELRATVKLRLAVLEASAPSCRDSRRSHDACVRPNLPAASSSLSSALCVSASVPSSPSTSAATSSGPDPTGRLIADAVAAASRLSLHFKKLSTLHSSQRGPPSRGRAEPAARERVASQGRHVVHAQEGPDVAPRGQDRCSSLSRTGAESGVEIWPGVGSLLSDQETPDSLWPPPECPAFPPARRRRASLPSPERVAEAEATPPRRPAGNEAGASFASRGRTHHRLRAPGPSARRLSPSPNAPGDAWQATEDVEPARRRAAPWESDGADAGQAEEKPRGVCAAHAGGERERGDGAERRGERAAFSTGESEGGESPRRRHVQTEQFLRALALCLPYLSLEDRIGGVALASKACLQVVWSAPIHSADFCAGRKTRPQLRPHASPLCTHLTSPHCAPRPAAPPPPPQGPSSAASDCLRRDWPRPVAGAHGRARAETVLDSCCQASADGRVDALGEARALSDSRPSREEPARQDDPAHACPQVLHEIDGEQLLMLPLFARRLAPRLTRLQALSACAASVPLISCLGATLRRLTVDKVQAPQQLHILHAWICAAMHDAVPLPPSREHQPTSRCVRLYPLSRRPPLSDSAGAGRRSVAPLLTSLSSFCSLRLLDLSSSSSTFGIFTRFFHPSVAFVSLPIHEDLSWALFTPNLRVLRLTSPRSLCSATCVKKLLRRLPDQLTVLAARAPKLLLVYVHLTVEPTYECPSPPFSPGRPLASPSRDDGRRLLQAEPDAAQSATVFGAPEAACAAQAGMPCLPTAALPGADFAFRIFLERERRQLERDARDVRRHLLGEEANWELSAAHPRRRFSLCFCVSRELEPLLEGNRLPMSSLLDGAPSHAREQADAENKSGGTLGRPRRSPPSSPLLNTLEDTRVDVRREGGEEECAAVAQESPGGETEDAGKTERQEGEEARGMKEFRESLRLSHMEEVDDDVLDLFLRDKEGSSGESDGDIVNPVSSFAWEDWQRLKKAIRVLPPSEPCTDKVHLLRGRRAKDLYAFWRIF